MIPASINNSDRGAIQFLTCMQNLLDAGDAKSKHRASMMIQTALAIASGSSACVPDEMARLQGFLEADDETVSRFGTQFLARLADMPEEMDTDFVRCASMDMLSALQKNANFPDECEMVGKFGFVLLAAFFPFPVSKSYIRCFETIVVINVPDVGQKTLDRLIGAFTPFTKDKIDFIPKPDGWRPTGFKIRRRRGF